MSERRLEKLFERIRFLRDKQRFFEGFASASALLGLASLKLVGIPVWIFVGAVVLATIGWIYGASD